MFKYTKIGVNVVSIVISTVIFLLIDLIIFNQNFAFYSNFYEIQEKGKSNNIMGEESVSNNVIKENFAQIDDEIVEITIENIDETVEEKQKENIVDTVNWQIIIPKISLCAEVHEGTTDEVMNSFVGHFEETSKTDGNIGLAAHNRGYSKNYFQNIKKLNEGDEIIYKYGNFEKIYIVEVHKIIKDVDWSYLEDTEENTITLITCVENEPNYRRCVQAVEKIDE